MQIPFIEQDCTFSHKGRSFTSGGAIVTDQYLTAYPGKEGRLNDWHGNQIGTYRILSSRPARFFGCPSWMGDRYYYMRATVNGTQYSLRGFGEGMIARGKSLKS